jgi:hypothetical protein
MVGIEGNIGDAKGSIRVGLHFVDVVTHGILNPDFGPWYSRL